MNLFEPLAVSSLRGLRRRATGTIYALCPWHLERTPSLRVRNGQAFCFGCGRAAEATDDWSVDPEQQALFSSCEPTASRASLDETTLDVVPQS